MAALYPHPAAFNRRRPPANCFTHLCAATSQLQNRLPTVRDCLANRSPINANSLATLCAILACSVIFERRSRFSMTLAIRRKTSPHSGRDTRRQRGLYPNDCRPLCNWNRPTKRNRSPTRSQARFSAAFCRYAD